MTDDQRVAELDLRIANLEASAWSGNKSAWGWSEKVCVEREALTGEDCDHDCCCGGEFGG